MSRRVLLSCDTRNEIDDQFAITYAVKSPECILHGVVNTQNDRMSGPDSVVKYQKEAEKVLSLCESDIPTMMGEPGPLNGRVEPADGGEFIIEQVKKYGSDLTVVIIGPATDVAAAWKHAPKIMKNAVVVFIGAWRNNEEMLDWKGLECNFSGDPVAFETIVNSDMNVTILPTLHVTDAMMYAVAPFQEELRKRNLPITNYLAELLDEEKGDTKILWDIAAVTTALGKGVTSSRQVAAPVLEDGKPVYPQTGDRLVTVIDEIDAEYMKEDGKKWILS